MLCLLLFGPLLKKFAHPWPSGLERFALEAGRPGFILSRVKPKTTKLVSIATLAKRSAIKCSAEDEINRE